MSLAVVNGCVNQRLLTNTSAMSSESDQSKALVGNLSRVSEIQKRALDCALYFRMAKPLAVISGAGVAGLAASFELRARGFNVIIAEKRKNFSRFNVININVEAQAFLKKFNLLEKFEKYAAARIKEHNYVIIEKTKSTRSFAHSDVSELQLDESIPFESENFDKLFEQDGIYSVPIGILQTFLAESALEIGVKLLGDVTVDILSRTKEKGVAEIRIGADQTLQPVLFFIAEGAHSTTARQLGMKTQKVINACTGENWIFGNMTYSGRESFVVSLIDISEKTLRIANVIFNAKSKVINIAVTSEKEVCEVDIQKQILQTVQQVFAQTAVPLKEMRADLVTTIRTPVQVMNRTCTPFSMGNVFCIGDSAGSSSPLAGLGGTLGLTLVPQAVKRIVDNYERQSEDINKEFNQFSEAYTARWIQKSANIKNFCVNLFDKEHTAI